MPSVVRLVFGVLRDARDHDIDALIERWGALMIETVEAAGLEAVGAVLRYLLTVRRIEDPRILLAAAREHGGERLEEIAMNAFDRVKAEGRAEGKAELLLRQLGRRFGPLAPALAERVRRATADELDDMADRVLSASTLEDVVG